MIKILRQIFRTGVVSEPLARGKGDDIILHGPEIEEAIRRRFRGSLTIRQVDAGSCSGCELEIHAMNNPIYNCERYGIHFTASPRFADMLMVTGPVAFNMETALRRTYNATTPPRLVLAVGDCACGCGIFGESYASIGGVDKVIPVNACVKGCPPSPDAIIEGIFKLLKK